MLSRTFSLAQAGRQIATSANLDRKMLIRFITGIQQKPTLLLGIRIDKLEGLD